VSLIPERLMALMTDEEKQAVAAIVDGWRFQPCAECPACGTRLGFKVRITTSAVALDTQTVTESQSPINRGEKWMEALNESERRIITEAEHAGLLNAFKQAVIDEKGSLAPGNMRKFLMEFLRSARSAIVPRFVLEEYLDVFGPARLDFYSSQGIFAVTADGVTRAFFPKSRFAGRGKKPSVAGAMPMQFRTEARMTEWIRGRFGYVPVDVKVFSQALGQPSVGAFGKLVQ